MIRELFIVLETPPNALFGEQEHPPILTTLDFYTGLLSECGNQPVWVFQSFKAAQTAVANTIRAQSRERARLTRLGHDRNEVDFHFNRKYDIVRCLMKEGS